MVLGKLINIRSLRRWRVLAVSRAPTCPRTCWPCTTAGACPARSATERSDLWLDCYPTIADRSPNTIPSRIDPWTPVVCCRRASRLLCFCASCSCFTCWLSFTSASDCNLLQSPCERHMWMPSLVAGQSGRSLPEGEPCVRKLKKVWRPQLPTGGSELLLEVIAHRAAPHDACQSLPDRVLCPDLGHNHFMTGRRSADRAGPWSCIHRSVNSSAGTSLTGTENWRA